jgi:hypothetical protein
MSTVREVQAIRGKTRFITAAPHLWKRRRAEKGVFNQLFPFELDDRQIPVDQATTCSSFGPSASAS